MITVDRKSLLAELALLRSIATEKSLAPILSTVKLVFDGHRLHLTATDTNITLLTSLPASGKPYAGCVLRDLLYGLVNLFTGDTVRLTPKLNDRLEAKSGSGTHLLPTLSTSAFPTVDKPAEALVTVNAATLNAMVQAVRFSVLEDSIFIKPTDRKFTGIQMSLRDGQFVLEASRKTTLAMASCPAEGVPFSVIIPPQAVPSLLLLAKDGSVDIGVADGLATFRCGDRTLIARTFIEQFPDFHELIPEFSQSVTINSTELKSAIRRTMLTVDLDARKRHESLRLTFTKDELLLESRGGSAGKSDERISVTSNLNGDSVVFGAFGDQLLSWLAIAGETGTCELLAPTMIRLTTANEGFTASYIICGTSLKEWGSA